MQNLTYLFFFYCTHPTDQKTWLADRTRAHGVHVPIIACTGQGELLGAGAGGEGVGPPVHRYPDACPAAFEEAARDYAQGLSDRGVPLERAGARRLPPALLAGHRARDRA